MVRRIFSSPSWCVALMVLLGSVAVSKATSPVLVSAVSRMTHGAAGTFDVQLPLTGTSATGSGIECRNPSAGLTIVFTFDQTVTSGSQSVTSSFMVGSTSFPGPVLANGSVTITGNTISVPLTSVTQDLLTITVTLSNVSNGNGVDAATNCNVTLRTIKGEVKAAGYIGGPDVTAIRAAVAAGIPVDGSNFRCDMNKQGYLTTGYVSYVRSAAVTSPGVAGGTTTNTAPTITAVSNQTAISGASSTPAGFTVSDAESAIATLAVNATTSDPVNLPLSSISINGTTASRSVSFSPPSGITAVTPVTVTLTVSDGLMAASTTFTVTINPPPTTYLAVLKPVAGTSSLGSGSATLVVSGDLTYATLTYNTSNLSGVVNDVAVDAPGDDFLLDLGAASAASGTKVWTFVGTVSNPLAFQLQTIQNNQSYLKITTSKYTNGELIGTFQLVTGSSTFTAPAAPPVITISPPSSSDASRFLQQAAFGGMTSEISNLSNSGFSNASTALQDWIAQQENTQLPIYPTYGQAYSTTPSSSTVGVNVQSTLSPFTTATTPYTYSPSSMYAQLYLRTTIAQSPNAYGDNYGDDLIHEAWYKNAVTGTDQLRQRVATALSEHFVISQIDGAIDSWVAGNAGYYDMLADDAFTNFLTLLTDVTLNPMMGEYLSMAGNGAASPNENYAREIMQLFTIGLYMLQPDGTLQLDINGQPIPTYAQTDITQFAQVYTGWNYDYGHQITIPTLPQPATGPVVVVNQNSPWNYPMLQTPSNHNWNAKTLLNYTGAATYAGASQPAFIPATTVAGNKTLNNANAELTFALQNIFHHPNVGPFIAKRLIQRMVCSNPSNGYIYRVGQVFANDGTGVRGNMGAVVKAILTDYEARSPANLSNPGYGHAREPIIHIAQMLRSLGGTSNSGKWHFGKSDTSMAQTIFRAPTVFNFFDPTYQQPGAVQAAGLVSPEMQVIYTTTLFNTNNLINNGLGSIGNYNYNNVTVSNSNGTPKLNFQGFHGDNESSDVYLDFSNTGTASGLFNIAQQQSVAAMVNQVVLLLNGPALDSSSLGIITDYITSTFPSDHMNQVLAAVYLVSTSAQASTQK